MTSPLHTPMEPTEDNDWASWWCQDEQQPCSSSNPCDCCFTELLETDDDE